MTAALIFSIFNTLVLIVWILYIFLPQITIVKWHLKYPIVLWLLALAYTLIIIPNLGAIGSTDFSSLEGIKKLFGSIQNDWFVMAAWFHYLCFDLWIGGWIVTDSQKYHIKKIWIAPCLLFAFMLGPVGFLMYWIVKMTKGLKE
jgi:hypothetical protein